MSNNMSTFNAPCVVVSSLGGFLIVFLAVLAALQADSDLHSTCKSVESVEEVFATTKPGIVLERNFGPNPCTGKKPPSEFDDYDCAAAARAEQAGADVTAGVKGDMETNTSKGTPLKPVTKPLAAAGMCPVNVHWHQGAEHRSTGQYDENGKGYKDKGRALAGAGRRGNQCHLYDKKKEMFKKPYTWKHCKDMYVGETYEVHWPHSAFGACGTPDQYQTTFYDGVFCQFYHESYNFSLPSGGRFPPREAVAASIGVQAQVFVVVNDEDYYYPDLMRGMIVDGDFGKDMAFYTGSTTGDKRNNEKCSSYSPITWQVDRKCHKISASSFDKLCADMKAQRDDMEPDTAPAGARVTTAARISADNVVSGSHGGGWADIDRPRRLTETGYDPDH